MALLEQEDFLFDLPDVKLKKSDRLLRIFEDIHDHIYANDGLSTQDVFVEVIKILFAKIYDEKQAKANFYVTEEEYESLSHGKLNKDFKTRFDQLIKATFRDFSDVLDDSDEIKIKDSTVAYVVHKLQEINLSESSGDVKGLAFQKFLLSSQRADRGQFFTPEQVVRLCVEIIRPNKDQKILDPACGSGGFLSQAMKFVFNTRLSDVSPKERKLYVQNNIFGIEINKMIAKVAKMRLILEGDGFSNLANFDSLSNWENVDFKKNGVPKGEKLRGYFDLILTNPPFGSQGRITNRSVLREFDLAYKWNRFDGRFVRAEEFQNGQVSDILFIERCLDFLKVDGKMAIVLPDGLFENSSLDYVRNYITRRSRILSVIKLPFDTFIPFGTGVKVSLLFLQKTRDNDDKVNSKVFFAKVEKIGYKGNKNGSITYKTDSQGKEILSTDGEPVVDEDISDVIEKFHCFLKSKNNLCEEKWFAVNHDRLKDRIDFDFYKPSYRFMEEELLKKGAKRLRDVTDIVKERSKKLKVKDEQVRYVELADINSDYCEISNSTMMPVHELPSRASFEIQTGDIITAVAGNSIGTEKHMSAVVTEEYAGAICTNGFRILRPKNGLDKFYLLFYLRSELFLKQVYTLRTGAAIPAISDEDFSNILVYLPSKKELESIVDRMNKSFKMREESRRLLSEIKLTF